ncbi:putative RNA-binding protein with RPS1 domain [Salinicoccus halitifaciens]
MNDYVHNVSQYLSKGQIVKAKVLSVGPDGKLNLTLKENEYFKNEEKKKDKRSIIEQIKDSEEYGFESLRQKMPQWIQEAKMRMQDK